ncbi:phosphatase PAP2 family protein [Nocardia donostiensis]|uniref:Phosphatidic acid phosphatase type 2/haloperoxidase domain-containing protein n=1 Tax=Nocardia donostiensis TaxID=1538463 RepID=A0A1V2TJN9_9NOCA|nr:phosphatase PAP2 family protein [Nocardia donostiensis]ONM49737.1 hypothetical protein B0T46_04785 [Nocardia donostiensis]OQS19830.1 hypothetical protein B0T44_12455 [Nocardia donostiensis]
MLVPAFLLAATAAIITGYVLFGDARTRSDMPVVDWVASWRGEPLTTVATVITHLGGSLAMWILALTVCAWCYRRGRRPELTAIAVAGLGALVTVQPLKHAIGRERPPVDGRLVTVIDPAYPSGHSLGSAAVVGTVAALAVIHARSRRIAVTAATAASCFVALVGLSRIYLGVHWPTDVLAGWAIGGLWVLAALAVHRRVGRTSVPTDSHAGTETAAASMTSSSAETDTSTAICTDTPEDKGMSRNGETPRAHGYEQGR